MLTALPSDALRIFLAGSGDSGSPLKWLLSLFVEARIRPCSHNTQSSNE